MRPHLHLSSATRHAARLGLFSTFLLAVGWWLPADVDAQDPLREPGAEGQAVGQQRAAAAEAYDRGTAAYLSGEYAQAAKWFETANRMAPAAAAVMQAIRSHLKADAPNRAATLALSLQREYPGDSAAQSYAEQVLDAHGPSYFLVEVECDADCAIDLNGSLQDTPYFYVEPSTSHEIVAHFDTGDVTREVEGAAGEQTLLGFSAPAASKGDPSEPLGPSDGMLLEMDEQTRLPPYVTFIGAGVTVALAGATLWSWLDANSGVEEYEALAADCRSSGDRDSMACRDAFDALDSGNGKETRSWVLSGATLAAAAGTGVVALLFTDWKALGSSQEEVNASVTPIRGGAAAFVTGRF